MKILFAASEAAPFAKTGGLADVAGSLPPALASLGHEVVLVMPRYRQVDIAANKLKRVATIYVPLGDWQERCDVLRGRTAGNVTVYFINKDIYFDRPDLYNSGQTDYPDNAERFIYFSRSVLELCIALDFRPDIVHSNDWQTGLVPLYLKRAYGSDAALRKAASVFTIHNLGYQGRFWHWDTRLIGLGWDVFKSDGIEFWGMINLLKAGIVFSDIVTTVSTTYSREIRTPEYGYGLEGVLEKRAAELRGIVNGIDYRTYDPAKDRSLPVRYSAAAPEGKAACKRALLERLGLPDRGAPLIGMVTRLADQKGLDLVAEALPRIMRLDAQCVILGTGDDKYHRLLSQAADQHPGALRVLLEYNDALAKKIYAGCDLFLMPSRYEPCGLGQMIAQRYGAVPVVRNTGGLADTVVDYSTDPVNGTGFVFGEYTAAALLDGIDRALMVYENKVKWNRLIRHGMKQDFSWQHSAKEYIKVYREAMKKR
ncbi:MAG TPA: glycogen synthase GlgA [Nitrospirota bacterium]|nr:glycogen synthase GlgA [Nitrospirota bacterium]